jgi:chromosome segregation protein
MFLRSLSLRGFKSFAERTTLEFTPGISVIVGPNGSGKSNIVDAISWVLGEQGPRALRGGQMADVIFAGSPARAALGMAEVKLVIDNSAGLIPVPMSELEISRAIFRTGESEYRIGGEVCRLLDIQELLAETGIGRAMHTVVGQGQLEDVLIARPEERRQFIEEAAGIAKHRRRKERAQRKLVSLEQDLLRLQDVLSELRRQLRPLKQQAEMAERHEKLTAQADEVAWRLAAARLKALLEERDSRAGGWQQGLAARAEAKAALQAVDEELSALAARRERTTTALGQAELAHERATARRGKAESDRRAAVDRVAEARAALARAQADSARGEMLARELVRLEAARDGAEALLRSRQADLERAEAEFRAAERAHREAEEERHRLAEQALAHRAEMETLRRQLASADRERDRILSSLEEVRGRIAVAAAERDALEREVERLDAVETPLASRQTRVEQERDSVAAEATRLEEQARSLEHRREVLLARRRLLEETPGSRFLEAHPGRAVGLLRDLVSAERGYERALGAAIGPLADAVVYDDASRALADAASADGAILGVPTSGRSSAGRPDGAQALIDRALIDPRARAFAGAILGDVYLADGPEHAAALHARHPQLAFVTRDGILVGASMIRTASASRHDARTEAGEVEAVERDLDRARRDLGARAARLAELDAEGEALRVRLSEADEAITAGAERMGRLGSELSTLGREQELLTERLAGLDDAQAAWREALAAPSPHHPDLPSIPPAPEPPMALRVEVEALRREARRIEESVAGLRAERDSLASSDPDAVQAELASAEEAHALAEAAVLAADEDGRAATARRAEAASEDRRVADAEADANRRWREQASLLERLREDYEEEDRGRADLLRRVAEAERLLKEGHERDPEEAVAALTEEDTVPELERRAELVARRLTLLGRVNLLAQGEYRTLQERHDFLVRELDDVKKSRRDLFELVKQVDDRIATLFAEGFSDVATEFELLFAELFPGGEGRLTLTDPDDPLTTGIELESRPGRKRVKRISLLSGGERALTALAFLFAIFRARPSPFYLLDEVEAALDDVNLHRFLGLMRSFADRSQVLLITHQKRTMEIADVLYGVSMPKDGSSTVVAQRLEQPGTEVARPAEIAEIEVSEPDTVH